MTVILRYGLIKILRIKCCFPFIVFFSPSLRAVVHVQVGDVNEFSPVFSSAVYSGSVQEGRVCDSILQVDATDRDCSPQYSQICNYQIVTENAPFAIDRNG